MSADSVSMPTLTASRKCYSKQIMLNSVSLSLVPSLDPSPTQPLVQFLFSTALVSSEPDQKPVLPQSFPPAQEASLTGELAPALLCLLFTCLLVGWCKGKEWRHSRDPMKRVESHSSICFASQPKLWPLFHLQFLLAYAFVVQYTIQIKVRYLISKSAQYLYMKLLTCFYDQGVILFIQ